MSSVGAGLLIWRRTDGAPEFLLVHPGGPFWAGKDTAAWSFPKGLADAGEDLRTAAVRECLEETGYRIDAPGPALTPHRMPGGKTVHAWLVEGDLDAAAIASNTFEMEWPPRSGRRATFPEVDRAAWFDAHTARVKLHRGLLPILDEAIRRLADDRC